jgi:transcriptional/translational regulatory protein YebC/TACO1
MTDDAEFQALASAPVSPTLKEKLKTAAANSMPKTVIDPREVIAKFGGNTEDSKAISYEREPDNEP